MFLLRLSQFLLGVSIFLISNTVTIGITVQKRRDCNHEIYRSEGLCSKITIRDRRSDHRNYSVQLFRLALLYFLYGQGCSHILWRSLAILKNIIDIPSGCEHVYHLLCCQSGLQWELESDSSEVTSLFVST